MHFAATHDYYLINHRYLSVPHAAYLMYVGALYYLVSLGYMLVLFWHLIRKFAGPAAFEDGPDKQAED